MNCLEVKIVKINPSCSPNQKRHMLAVSSVCAGLEGGRHLDGCAPQAEESSGGLLQGNSSCGDWHGYDEHES